MTKPSLIAATAIASLTAIAWTPLANYGYKSGTHFWRAAVSGVPGSVIEITPPEMNQPHQASLAVHKISLYENYDNPTKISVGFNALKDGGSGTMYPIPKRTTDAILGPESSASAGVGNTHHMTALRVCVNNEKIKGLMVWGRAIQPNGKLSAAEVQDKFELPNCKDQWQEKIECGEGKVITGIRAHYKNAAKGFSGLAIRCTGIEQR